MTENVSRRDFLKLASVGAATTAILTGCGPASRYVTREPYAKMPEYTYNGLSTYYATTCRECSAGCGLIVRTMQGRAIKVEGNPNHPVNMGKTCARGQATLHGLYNPDRVTGPSKHARGTDQFDAMDWDAAVNVVTDALKNHKPDEVAFLMGLAPDHLFDLVSDLAKAMGASAPIRFGALSMFEARATLVQATQELFGQAVLPFFDIGNASLTFSFGANFLETWLSPVAYTRGFSNMRRGPKRARGYFVQFEPRMSQTAAKADEWIPIKPGTENLVALAIGRLVAEARGGAVPQAFSAVDVNAAVSASGVGKETLEHLADLFNRAEKPLAIPGGPALGQNNGLQTAESILALNALGGTTGAPGGVFFSAASPTEDAYHRPASAKEMQDFIQTLKSGKVKVLFVHGVNPVFELPASLGFAEALKSVSQVISFATFPDETAMQADYVFPDRHALESWGYQRIATGSTQSALSGAQPVIEGVYQEKNHQNELVFNVRATADVFLAAATAAGGSLAAALPYKDEVAFIQGKIAGLVGQLDGAYIVPDADSLSAYFQQFGGWWKTTSGLGAPSVSGALDKRLEASQAAFDGDGEFYLLPFVSPVLGEAGANKPWLQEISDPTTTVMWNSWVEINPKTAEDMGIEDDDVVSITSPAGTVEVSVYKYPAIRPDTIAIPFGQGHSAYGQFAAGRGINPADLLAPKFNEAGDLTFAGEKVTVKKTGKKRVLSRFEGKLGVYGFEAK